MRGKSFIKDWDKVPWGSTQVMPMLKGAFQHFITEAEQAQAVPDRAAMQHYATTGDFPASVLELLEKYRVQSTYDNGWESVFDVRDFTGSTRNGFSYATVEDGLTFAITPIGKKADIYKFGGTKSTVTFERYSGGLGWDRTLFDDREYWTLEDNAFAFMNKAMSFKSQTFYDLIDAVGAGQNLAWQAVDGAIPNTDPLYIPNRDANTINAACIALLRAFEDTEIPVSPQTQFVLLAPIELQSRLSIALNYAHLNVGATPKINFRILPVYTMMLSATDKYYIAIPKAKNKAGIRQNLTVFDKFDPVSYSDISVGWMRFGGAVNSTQFKRCSVA